MDRRQYLRVTAGAATAGLAGCLGFFGGDQSPPPRRAQVFADVRVQDAAVVVEFADRIEVESRQEVNANLKGVADSDGIADPDGVADLAPVGVADAQKGRGGRSGRGATGRGTGGYRSAPKGRHGWAVWHSHDDDDEWREDHDDEIRMYPARVDRLGLTFLGPTAKYEDDPPGPEPVPWERTRDDPEPGETVRAPLSALTATDTPREGWYRLGVHLVHANGGADFGWQAADAKVDREGNWEMEKAWHVRPQV